MMRCEKRTEKEDEEEEVKMKEQKKDKEDGSAALILRFALKVFFKGRQAVVYCYDHLVF